MQCAQSAQRLSNRIDPLQIVQKLSQKNKPPTAICFFWDSRQYLETLYHTQCTEEMRKLKIGHRKKYIWSMTNI